MSSLYPSCAAQATPLLVVLSNIFYLFRRRYSDYSMLFTSIVDECMNDSSFFSRGFDMKEVYLTYFSEWPDGRPRCTSDYD